MNNKSFKCVNCGCGLVLTDKGFLHIIYLDEHHYTISKICICGCENPKKKVVK